MSKGTDERLKKACELFVVNGIINPVEGYSFEEAMKQAGYSQTYARKSAYLVRAKVGTQDLIDREKEKFEAKRLWDLEQIEREFIEQYIKADKAADRTNALRALESLMKRHGGYREDAPNPAREYERRKFTESKEIELRQFVERLTRQLAVGEIPPEEVENE